MRELLIISNEQFGYHTDSYKYCQYLRNEYDITYLCFSKGQEHILMEGISVVYVPWKSRKLIRSVAFISKALRCMLQCKGVTFIVYFNGFSVLHLLLPWKKAILDIRTLSVSPHKLKRRLEDSFLKFTAKTFSYVTVISKGVIKKLNISPSKAFLLPLGADVISDKKKNFDSLRLLYVGTLTGRKILDTVKGFHAFHQNNLTGISLSYDIVGDGEEKKQIEQYVKENGLDNVTVHGYIPHHGLTSLFDTCNIGVSFVPMTEYYDDQPATKTFEYVFSGLYTIATNTKSNREVISAENGILIDDSLLSFRNALQHIAKVLPELNDKQIRDSLLSYSWKNIVDHCLDPVLKKACN